MTFSEIEKSNKVRGYRAFPPEKKRTHAGGRGCNGSGATLLLFAIVCKAQILAMGTERAAAASVKAAKAMDEEM